MSASIIARPALGARARRICAAANSLASNTYLALPATPVTLSLDGMQRARRAGNCRASPGATARCSLPTAAPFTTDASLRALDLRLRSTDMGRCASLPVRLAGRVRPRQRGVSGASDLRLVVRDGRLQAVDANLHDVDLREPDDRFGFRGLDGDVRFSDGAAVQSALRWRSSRIYGLISARPRCRSTARDGELVFREPVVVPAMGGR